MVIEDNKITKRWYEMCDIVISYCKKHGDLNVPACYIDETNKVSIPIRTRKACMVCS